VDEPLQQSASSPLSAVSNALVALHKEQFGRGPTHARTYFAGPDGLVCILEDALLPAERKMAEMGDAQRVRESRMAFQVATGAEFVATVETLLQRRVVAFGSATDVEQNTIFENFVLEPSSADGNHDGRRATAV
jgi:uncharacterized protein YbcI